MPNEKLHLPSRTGAPANPPSEPEDQDDERTVRSGATATRGDRGIVEDAAREEMSGLMSDEDFVRLVRDEFEQTALPTPPPLPGWHLCWLTTTSQYDSISKRQRIGYRPVRRDELPGFDPSNGQGLQDFAGVVTCNEMVLHKIPERYYQKMMEYFHHKRPLEDQRATLEKVKVQVDGEEQDQTGRDLTEMGNGYLDMERSAKREERAAPRFA